MPLVIQPGGGGGKMRVRCTTHRKRGLVAASKRMQAEGITLRATASELCVNLPREKKSVPNPLKKCSCHTIPQPFQPKPLRPMSDCHIFHAGDWAEQLNFTTRSQNEGDPTTPPPTKIVDFPS